MKPQEIIDKVVLLRNKISKQKHTSVQTKYQTITLFKYIIDAVKYRVPMKPIDISEDGKTFRCPRCETLMESEDYTYEGYDICPICGQLFKEEKDMRLAKIKERMDEDGR